MYKDDEDHSAWRAWLHALGGEAVGPRAGEIDATGYYPSDIHQRFAEEGLLALTLPPRLGGPADGEPAGVGALTLATEVMAQYSSAAGLMLLLSRLPAVPVLTGGTEEQQGALLPDLAAGRTRASFAMSEPHAGSDVVGISTIARQDGAHWLLSGHKAWISGAAEADWFVVIATIAGRDERRAGDLRAFVVPRDTPGVRVVEHPRSSVRGMSLGDLLLDEARIPSASQLPGIIGIGSLLGALATMRPVVAARGLGLAQAALMLATEYAEARVVAGGPVASHEGVRWQLARAAISIEAARLLTHRAADLVDTGRSGPESAGQLAMAKLAATECAVEVSGLAVQLHGAAGSLPGHPVERLHRDARTLTIVEGTSEIQLGIVARALADRHVWWGGDAR